MKIVSHTIVKHGMPFLGPVVRQVLPFVNRALITVSEKADVETIAEINSLRQNNKDKVFIFWENVKHPSELTKERQKLVEKTYEDWILFLDDDDWWPHKSLGKVISNLNDDIDAVSVQPMQIIDENHYDVGWKSWIGRWYRNGGLEYKHPWPRDLIYKNGKLLYWKKNDRNLRIIDAPFYHLARVKDYSFRNELWAKEYVHRDTKIVSIPQKHQIAIRKILNGKNK